MAALTGRNYSGVNLHCNSISDRDIFIELVRSRALITHPYSFGVNFRFVVTTSLIHRLWLYLTCTTTYYYSSLCVCLQTGNRLMLTAHHHAWPHIMISKCCCVTAPLINGLVKTIQLPSQTMSFRSG